MHGRDRLMRRLLTLVTVALFAVAITVVTGCAQTPATDTATSTTEATQGQADAGTPTSTEAEDTADTAETEEATDGAAAADTRQGIWETPGEGLTLDEVVVLSRHDIRAPLSTKGSVLDLATPHAWCDWTANAAELTLHGGAMEVYFGQTFRRWLVDEGLITESFIPEEGQVRFYANAKQRTIATPQYFLAGMFPVGRVTIETHVPYDEMDPVFTPGITFMNDAYEAECRRQIQEIAGGEDPASGLEDAFALLYDVLDLKDAPAYKSGEFKDLSCNDTTVNLVVGDEPTMSGSLKTANALADALVLQYYQMPDELEATFGHELTPEQWDLLSSIKDRYNQVLFESDAIAAHLGHPLLETIASELDQDGRIFSFLCGHDSNIATVIRSINVEPYELPDAIEHEVPIASKLLFERYLDESGKAYGRVRLVYPTLDNLRSYPAPTDGSACGSVTLSLEGISADEDGLMDYDALRDRLQEAVDSYDTLVATYQDAGLDEAA